MTTSKDVLEAVASGKGPARFLLTLGHAGWGAGQLEEEIAKNGWLTVEADPRIVFDVPAEERLQAALRCSACRFRCCRAKRATHDG
jgi:putative transcriptional regulator